MRLLCFHAVLLIHCYCIYLCFAVVLLMFAAVQDDDHVHVSIFLVMLIEDLFELGAKWICCCSTICCFVALLRMAFLLVFAAVLLLLDDRRAAAHVHV